MNKLLVVAAMLAAGGTASAQSPMIQAQLRNLGATFAPGQVPASQIYGGFAPENQEMPFMVELQAGRCYTFVGTVGPGVQQLSIYLFDPTGKTVIKDTTDKSVSPHVTHCAQWPGMYKILGKIKRGSGELAIQAFTTGGAPPPPPQAAAPPPPPPVTVAPPPQAGYDPLAAAVDQQASVNAPGYRRYGEFYRGFANKRMGFTDWFVTLEAGKCYSFIGAGGPGVEELSLFLWAPNNARVTDRKVKSPQIVMPYCAVMPGPHHLQAKVARGAGEFRVGVYTP